MLTRLSRSPTYRFPQAAPAGGVQLTWSGSPGLGVEIYRGATYNPGGGTFLATTPAGVTEYFDNTAVDNVTYQYWARGLHAAGPAGFTLPDEGTAGSPLTSDINADGAVDGADLGVLLSLWGQPGGVGDVNGDGIVNGADLGILLGEWTG